MKAKRLLIFAFLILTGHHNFAQNLDGIWRGYFFSGRDSMKVVVELITSGDTIRGKSYTRVYDAGQTFDVTCNLEGEINNHIISFRETKIVTMKPYFKQMSCFQEYSLTLLVTADNKRSLNGIWKGTDISNCGKGRAYFTERKSE